MLEAIESAQNNSIIVGMAMIIISLLADGLGFGSSGGLGSGRILLFLAGLGEFLFGLLGKKIGKVYQGVDIILLNIINLDV